MDLHHDKDLVVDVVVEDGDNNDGAGAGGGIAAVRGKNDVDAFEAFVALVAAVFCGAGGVHFLTNKQQMLHDMMYVSSSFLFGLGLFFSPRLPLLSFC